MKSLNVEVESMNEKGNSTSMPFEVVGCKRIGGRNSCSLIPGGGRTSSARGQDNPQRLAV